MNAILLEMLETETVTDGTRTFPLVDNMDADEGKLIARLFSEAKPIRSLEVGCAYGVASLYACDAMAATGSRFHHTIVDPNQSTDWKGIGRRNIERAGYAANTTILEERSETALPRLLAEGMRIQAAIIDGWHTFDHTLVDFFFVNKMLDVGGVVLIDDARWNSIMPVVDHIATYPAYEYINRPHRTGGRISTHIRRFIRARTQMPRLRRSWEYPTCAAFRKSAEDVRNFDWHVVF